jgi:hypothetical protein
MESQAHSDQPVEVPTFGVNAVGLSTFVHDVTFPINLEDGKAYLARLGHAGRGWRESSDYLLAVYRTDGQQLVPVAGLSIDAVRSRIVSVRPRRDALAFARDDV